MPAVFTKFLYRIRNIRTGEEYNLPQNATFLDAYQMVETRVKQGDAAADYYIDEIKEHVFHK